MSPDLERRLRDARELLPEPDPAATHRARERVVAAVRRRRRRLPPALALAAALVAAVTAGVVIGASTAPSVTAGRGPLGVGFVPEPGWYVLHAPGRAPGGTQFAAIASNVPFDPADDLGGLATPSGLPYATLLDLPPEGIVLAAVFTERYEPLAPSSVELDDALPLRLSEAEDVIPFSAQIRPQDPLGQYHLTAHVGDFHAAVNAYFGVPNPSPAMVAAAQRQLDRLVIQPGLRLGPAAPARTERAPTTAARSTWVVDRTFSCGTSFGKATVVASPRGTSEVQGARLISPGYMRVTSGPGSDPLADLLVAARPGRRNAGTPFPGAVYASARRCTPTRTTVPLERAGLPGPPTAFRSEADCTVRGKVLVRVRATLRRSAEWRRLRGAVGAAYLGVDGRIVEAELAVRDRQTGRQLAFAKLGRTGATQIWSAARCS